MFNARQKKRLGAVSIKLLPKTGKMRKNGTPETLKLLLKQDKVYNGPRDILFNEN